MKRPLSHILADLAFAVVLGLIFGLVMGAYF
jgi:hypothetical protein